MLECNAKHPCKEGVERRAASSRSHAPSGSQIRELALRLVHCGYQAGHNDTVEGTFSDDLHGTDSEYIHGERVDEIIQDFSANSPVHTSEERG